MALRRFDLKSGGDSFSFREETEPNIAFWLGKYPEDRKRSAVIPLLWLAQKDNGGWLSEPAMREVADRLEMPYIRVYEVATFYTMFRLQPVGRNHIQLCGTTPCMLRGANELKEVCRRIIGKPFAVTDDGRLSWEEVECLGACVNAPMVQVNDYYYEDLTPEQLEQVLGKLQNGVEVAPGTFAARLNSAPEGEPTTLEDPSLYDGSRNTLASLPNLPGAVSEADPVPDVPEKATRTTIIERTAEKPAEAGAPKLFESAPDVPDDLKKIKGIGPVIEKTLNELGVYTFEQVAAWSQENVDWVEESLSFPGRIEREDWIAQAKALSSSDEEN